ncbi:MAG: heliorhodopsin HeR [Thermoplasmata archaeon]
MEKKTTEKKLRKFNMMMGVVHLFQGILVLILSTDFTLPIRYTYLKFDTATETLVPVVRTLTDVPIGPVVALFLFISAAAHLLISTVLFKKYVINLRKERNPYRWYEYSVSASLMIVLIAMLTGIYDLGTLVALFGLTAAMNLCGLLMEKMNVQRKGADWSPFWIGCLAGLIPWIAIAVSLLGASVVSGGQVPDFVIAIYISIAVFFNLFVVNMVLQYKEVGKWKDYLYGERMYIVLSLVAKSALAWQVFAGTLRP